MRLDEINRGVFWRMVLRFRPELKNGYIALSQWERQLMGGLMKAKDEYIKKLWRGKHERD